MLYLENYFDITWAGLLGAHAMMQELKQRVKNAGTLLYFVPRIYDVMVFVARSSKSSTKQIMDSHAYIYRVSIIAIPKVIPKTTII